MDAVPASATASALIFRPPIASDVPPPELARAPRMPSAFVGYEEPITESYHVYTIDRQISDGYFRPSGSGYGYGGYLDRYERRAIIEKTGVLHR